MLEWHLLKPFSKILASFWWNSKLQITNLTNNFPDVCRRRGDLDVGDDGRGRDGIVGAAGCQVLQDAPQVQRVEHLRRYGHHGHHLKREETRDLLAQLNFLCKCVPLQWHPYDKEKSNTVSGRLLTVSLYTTIHWKLFKRYTFVLKAICLIKASVLQNDSISALNGLNQAL